MSAETIMKGGQGYVVPASLGVDFMSPGTTLDWYGITNGVSTGGTYNDPNWLTGVNVSKLVGTLSIGTLGSTGTAGTYSRVTTDAQGRVTSGTARSFNSTPTKTLVTSTTGQGGVVLDASRDVRCDYWIDTSITTTIGGTSSTTVFIEIAATNSATASDWTTIGKVSNGNTITLALALQSVIPQTLNIGAMVPAAKYMRIRYSTAGTASATYGGGQEVKL